MSHPCAGYTKRNMQPLHTLLLGGPHHKEEIHSTQQFLCQVYSLVHPARLVPPSEHAVVAKHAPEDYK
eukprot:1723721-Ditylum_brightwellii.AAC.1